MPRGPISSRRCRAVGVTTTKRPPGGEHAGDFGGVAWGEHRQHVARARASRTGRPLPDVGDHASRPVGWPRAARRAAGLDDVKADAPARLGSASSTRGEVVARARADLEHRGDRAGLVVRARRGRRRRPSAGRSGRRRGSRARAAIISAAVAGRTSSPRRSSGSRSPDARRRSCAPVARSGASTIVESARALRAGQHDHGRTSARRSAASPSNTAGPAPRNGVRRACRSRSPRLD